MKDQIGRGDQPLIASIPTLGKKLRERAIKAFGKHKGNLIPTFTEVANDFDHMLAKWPGAFNALDVKATNVRRGTSSEALITGGLGQHNSLIAVEDGVVKDLAEEYGLLGKADEAAYSIVVGDIDNDGEDEILIGTDSGIYVYSRSAETARYSEEKLDIVLPDTGRSNPMAMTLGDTQGAGSLDLYVGTFIKPQFLTPIRYNNPEVSVDNAFYVNQGDGTFVESTEAAGLMLHSNCYDASFTDFTGDGYPDLVVALNTDRPRMWGNNGDGTFTEKQLPGGYGFWMGLAIGDSNGNGLPDFFLANSGKTVPTAIARGDLHRDQKSDLASTHFRNEGDYIFRAVTHETGTVTDAFAWGSIFADFTNNGRLDLVVTENFVGYPLNLAKHFAAPGKLFLQGVDGKFVRAEEAAGVANYNYGYRALAVDLTGNGFNDLVIGNLSGPLRVLLNDLGQDDDVTTQGDL